MKKTELKKDPIRDRLLNFLNYLDSNRNVLYGSLTTIAIILILFIFVDNKSEFSTNSSNLASGKAQNYYIDENKDISILKFNEILNGSFSSESKDQALIYLLSHAIENNDNDKINDLINNYKIKTKDNILYSNYNNIIGDYYFDIKNYSDAIKYYKKSLKNYDDYCNNLIGVKISIIKSYIFNDDLKSANKYIDLVDLDNLNISNKNKFLLFKQSIHDKLN